MYIQVQYLPPPYSFCFIHIHILMFDIKRSEKNSGEGRRGGNKLKCISKFVLTKVRCALIGQPMTGLHLIGWQFAANQWSEAAVARMRVVVLPPPWWRWCWRWSVSVDLGAPICQHHQHHHHGQSGYWPQSSTTLAVTVRQSVRQALSSDKFCRKSDTRTSYGSLIFANLI